MEACMFRVSRWLILPALLCAAPSYSQQVEPGKRTEGPVEAEVRLMDNSNVRMLILEEKLEVCTRFRKDDIITTTSFPIIGRITTHSLKAKNDTFGEVELKLGQVRAIHCCHAPHETTIEVDASRYGSATNQWLDTSFEARSGMRLIIAA